MNFSKRHLSLLVTFFSLASHGVFSDERGDYPAGTYVIVATAFGSRETGTYRLTSNATLQASATPVPTLGQWGLVSLSLTLGAAALRRRRRS